MANNAHRISWFVYAHDGLGAVERMPRESTMRGRWGYDVECSCGWSTRTGGALRSYVESEVRWHKFSESE